MGKGIYQQIKELVSARDVAEHYGYKVNRHGMMRCPFHNDHIPSLKIGRNFICFGCHEKGDVIRFASLLFGLSPYEAAMKLINEMNLQVRLPKKKTADVRSPPAQSRANKDQKEQRLFERAIKHVRKVYLTYYGLLDEWSLLYAPHTPDEGFPQPFIEAM